MRFPLFLYCFFLGFITVFAQAEAIENDSLKAKIESYYNSKKIDSINDLLKKEESFSPEFIFEKLNRNLTLAKKLENDKLIGRTYYAIGNFWLNRGNRIKAYENYVEAESVFRKMKNSKDLAAVLMNKSTVLQDRMNRIKILEEASLLMKKEKDTFHMVKAYMNIGAAYAGLYSESKLDSAISSKLNFRKKAFEFYDKAGELNTLFQNEELQGVLYIYYGEFFQYEENFEKAIPFLTKAKEIFIHLKDSKSQTYCNLLLGHIYAKEKEYHKAFVYLNDAEEMSKKYELNDYLVMIYEEFTAIYTTLGDYKKALAYHQLYSDKAIEFAEQSNNEKMNILSLEKNISENKLKLAEYETKIYRNRIVIFSVAFLALLILIISWFIIHNNRRKTKLIENSKIITDIKLKNQLLEDQLLKEKVRFGQEHLMSFANEVHKIENFLDEMKNKVRKIGGSQEEINSLKLSFSELLNGKAQLKQANSLSSELNQDFFFYLRKNYPGISKGDEQMLSYIILNIGSKEISRILNISDKSIYIKRYRLRKKLNLKNEETFEDFYHQILSVISEKSSNE